MSGDDVAAREAAREAAWGKWLPVAIARGENEELARAMFFHGFREATASRPMRSGGVSHSSYLAGRRAARAYAKAQATDAAR